MQVEGYGKRSPWLKLQLQSYRVIRLIICLMVLIDEGSYHFHMKSYYSIFIYRVYEHLQMWFNKDLITRISNYKKKQ